MHLADLERPLLVDGQEVHMVVRGPGIIKPRQLDAALTLITASPKPGKAAPYKDEWLDDGRLLYRYRGEDPNAWDNQALRRAVELQVPLVYLHGVAKGWYLATRVFVVEDVPEQLAVVLDDDPRADASLAGGIAPSLAADLTRTYRPVLSLARLHQQGFRRRVLAAYQQRCAMCRLARTELLDAAHILPDRCAESRPEVSNGLALCALHHRAYDARVPLVGVRPDLVVEVRDEVLDDQDGPMLTQGLQSLHGQRLQVVPRRDDLRPKEQFLEWRYEQFRAAS